MMLLSDACAPAKVMAAYFSFWLSLRIIHLMYTGYRTICFRRMKGKWAPLLRYHGVISETIEDVCSIIGHSLFLAGIPYIGFFFMSCAASVGQINMITSTYLICSKLVEPFQSDTGMAKFDLNYGSNLRIAMMGSVLHIGLAAIKAYFWRQHQITNFAIMQVIGSITGWLLALWLSRALYKAGKDCEALILR